MKCADSQPHNLRVEQRLAKYSPQAKFSLLSCGPQFKNNFTFLNVENNQKKNNIFDMRKLCKIQISSVHEFQPGSLVYVLPMVTFVLQWQC